jgi:IS30 family transposase
VQRIEDALNDRPRESLGFETPNEVFFRALMAERHVALDG